MNDGGKVENKRTIVLPVRGRKTIMMNLLLKSNEGNGRIYFQIFWECSYMTSYDEGGNTVFKTC